jgi:anti-sigma factor RsiW
MTHLTTEQLDAFAQGTLPADHEAALGLHVRACSACARRVRDEAALELLLRDVANAPPARATPRRRRRALVAALCLAAGLAAVLLWRLPAATSPEPQAGEGAMAWGQGPGPGLRCANGPEQDECLQRAHHRGLIVSYPPSARTLYGPEEL